MSELCQYWTDGAFSRWQSVSIQTLSMIEQTSYLSLAPRAVAVLKILTGVKLNAKELYVLFQCCLLVSFGVFIILGGWMMDRAWRISKLLKIKTGHLYSIVKLNDGSSSILISWSALQKQNIFSNRDYNEIIEYFDPGLGLELGSPRIKTVSREYRVEAGGQVSLIFTIIFFYLFCGFTF